MKKAACNRSRLSNVIENDNFGESLQSLTFSPQEKKVSFSGLLKSVLKGVCVNLALRNIF